MICVVYQALKLFTLDLFQASDKLNMILNIWQSGYGVISLHVFHNTIPVEAYTREACMIEALGNVQAQMLPFHCA